jgi:O-antigen/teichoic acid export membrane protein
LFKTVNRHDLVAVLILLLLPLLLFWPVTVGSQTLLPVDNLFAFEPWLSYRDALGVGHPQNQLVSDLILENYVWKKLIREAIDAGQIPLWNPYILSGQPFLANGQHSGLYPFSLLFYIMPLSKAYGWFTVLQLWLAGLNMYIFIRVLRFGRLGALVAAIVYALSGFFVVRVVFTMIIAGAVWLPLMLAMIEVIIRKQEDKGPVGYSPIPFVVAGAFVLGVQTLAGHVEITYYTLLVSGYYGLVRLLLLWYRQRTLRYALRLAAWLLVMVLLGLGLGAVQLVPMYEVVSQNFRDSSVTLAEVRGWALPARRIISFLLPDFFGSPAHHGYFDLVSRQWQRLGLNAAGTINPLCPNCTGWDTKTAVEAGAYIAILPLILAFLAVLQAIRDLYRRWRARPVSPVAASASYTLIFAGLAVLSLLFAFGTPLYAILFYGLPGWNQLHSPFRWIFPYTLSMAILTGIGISYLNHFVSNKRNKSGTVQKLSVEPEEPSFFYRLVSFLGWGLFWSGLAGTIFLMAALVFPQPFIAGGQVVLDQSGLAQNAFAGGRQFAGYQWLNFLKFFLMVTASGTVLRLVRCPIFVPRSNLQVWKPLAVVVIAIDLLAAGSGFNPAADPALLEFKPKVVSWLEDQQSQDPLFRINSFDTPTGRGNKLFLANAGILYGNLFDVRGYDSIIPAQYSRFMQLIQENGDLLFNRVGPVYYDGYAALDSALLDLLGVRYILTTVDIDNPNYALVYDDEIRVYENLDALSRAFVVNEAIRVEGADQTGWSEEFRTALRSLDPRKKLILDGTTNQRGRELSPADIASQPPDSTPSAVEVIRYTPNEVVVAVTVSQPGWLVLADSYFPGWRAFISQPEIKNGAPAVDSSPSDSEIEVTIHRANGTLRAVQIQPGSWLVRFRYSPQSFQLGLYLSFLSGAILLFMAGYWAWGKVYRETDSDSHIKRVAKNSLVPMVMALSNRVIDFAFALLMLRILQPEGAGKYAFAVAFIGLSEIVIRFGLGTLVTRDVAADRTQSNRYLSNVSLLRALLWLGALPLMAVILAMYVIFGETTLDVVITIAIFTIGTFFSNLSDGLTAVFYAHEKAEYPAGVSAITTFTRVTIGAMVLLLGWGIIGLAGASLVANLVAFLVLSWLLLTKIFRPHLENDPALQRQMLRESFPLMINHMLSTIFFRIDVFILEPMWGSREVGYYSAAYKYIDGINVIPQYFTLAIFPLMSRFAADSRESLVRAYHLSLRLLLILALPLAVGTPFVAYELIWFLAGEAYLPDSMIVLQLLIWFLPFSFINQVTQYVLIAINQQRALTTAFVIGVLFNTITNLIFIPMYGYRAAAITTIVSEWSLLIPFYLLIRKHLCTVPWFDVSWRPAVAALIMGVVLWGLGDINFFITVLVAGVVYIVALAAVGGLTQSDMRVLWRTLPLSRLKAKLPFA